ncbi:MAG: toll/interleukin-1 receptor domain-containing protein [Anaerolineae bacterium]|nr:toll/interleukin-1 receptor domain-containing protein [Anaerolineae bacterium]
MSKQNIFISYSHVDRDFATHIASALAKEGVNIWIDVEDIPPGENWRNAIDEGLKTAEIMLLIISPESMASVEVQSEWNYFLDEKKQIIPVLYRKAEIPARLRLIQWVDFSRGGSQFDNSLALLRDRLKLPIGVLSKSPVPTAQKTGRQPDSPRDNSGNRTQIIVALIGAAAVIAAAAIGLIPAVLNQMNATPASNTLTPSQVVTLPGSPLVSPVATSSPVMPDVVTPSVPVGTFDITLIYGGADSFVVRANAVTNFSGLAIRSTAEDVLLTDAFSDLAVAGFVLQPGDCLVFLRTGETSPLPRGCQRPFERELASNDTFWYDNTGNRVRDLVMISDSNTLGICSAQGGTGTCNFKNS